MVHLWISWGSLHYNWVTFSFIFHSKFFLFCIAHSAEQSLGSSNIAELSPGAIDACRSEYHATFNSMMMERMTTDINALKRQYSRIKKKQQQQVHQVYIRAGNSWFLNMCKMALCELRSKLCLCVCVFIA